MAQLLLDRNDVEKFRWIAIDLTKYSDNPKIKNPVHVEFFLYKEHPELVEEKGDFPDSMRTVWWETPKSSDWDKLYDFDITEEAAKQHLKDIENLVISIEEFTTF